VILVVLNVRVYSWMAIAHQTGLAEIHRLLPAWAVPTLTLALLIWSGLLLAATRPARR